MFKIYKIILPALLAITTAFSMSGCGNDTSAEPPVQDNEISTEAASIQQKEVVSYETVKPPEGGWTTEEIMNVTYFCDKKLSYPLSLDALGDDFSLSHYSRSQAKKRLVPATLRYNGKRFANATVVKPHDETMIYNIVLFPDVCKVEDVEPFVINGVKMYDTFEDVVAALGDEYFYMNENESILYNDRETNESLYSLFFEDGKLVHINVDFRFEIDLPLYKNLRE